MANPTSSADLIRKHSKARVINASDKPFVIGVDNLTGLPKLSRAMTNDDDVEALAKKFG